MGILDEKESVGQEERSLVCKQRTTTQPPTTRHRLFNFTRPFSYFFFHFSISSLLIFHFIS